MAHFPRRNPADTDSSLDPSSGSRLRAAPRASGQSGTYSAHYVRVREILVRYLSSVLVDSVLEKAMVSRRLSPRTLDASELAEITGDIMLGLRMFVPEERLPLLMLELAEVLELPPK